MNIALTKKNGVEKVFISTEKNSFEFIFCFRQHKKLIFAFILSFYPGQTFKLRNKR